MFGISSEILSRSEFRQVYFERSELIDRSKMYEKVAKLVRKNSYRRIARQNYVDFHQDLKIFYKKFTRMWKFLLNA